MLLAKKSDSKKDLLRKAAGDAVRKTLGGETAPIKRAAPDQEHRDSGELNEKTDPVPESDQGDRREKQLPKKDTRFRINNGMRIDEYTQAPSLESNGNKKWLRILGIVFVVLLVWWLWPAKHEIYMDVDKMTPDKVAGRSSEKEYHFAHGQDFFIYYKRGGWFSPKKVKLTIYKLDDNRAEISVQEKEFKKRIEKFQTYYDDSFFDDEGSYEVEVKDEDEEILVTKKFTID
ncbi:hypothetical protein LEP1GSC058_3612 [Leptospira fainei serovar Hurstbridge str. BUT 6]|uniref:Uncharacterized protein n=1 Tax=Leptospira fainei serovar Hurstbridge str. BUT 6 TaxID=1193011 RepID=S3VY47_9LEPT|nr:hypothetical protein [Leptospira fainei]EPG73032.1 hypothetical protein LEP1GSC058_3612 [Leptospira fainei serovar Hurstbridge str. BUT 6]